MANIKFHIWLSALCYSWFINLAFKEYLGLSHIHNIIKLSQSSSHLIRVYVLYSNMCRLLCIVMWAQDMILSLSELYLDLNLLPLTKWCGRWRDNFFERKAISFAIFFDLRHIFTRGMDLIQFLFIIFNQLNILMMVTL